MPKMHTRPTAEIKAEYEVMVAYVAAHLANGEDPNKWILAHLPDYLRRAGSTWHETNKMLQGQSEAVREVLQPGLD